MAASTVSAEVADRLGVLTLDAARRRNPLSLATMRAATRALHDFDADPAVRVIIIKANGPAFSAGHDLTEMVGRTIDEEREIFAACTELMTAVHEVRQPVIAQVQGMALAAGCQLAATCDLAIAADTARFSTPGVKIGLFCSTPMVALSRKVPASVAFEMLTTGQFIDARRAAEIGLVNRVCPADQLDSVTQTLAETIAAKLTGAVRIGKRAFYEQGALPLAAAYDHAGRVMVENMLMRDTDEGISAFLEKRAPVWPKP